MNPFLFIRFHTVMGLLLGLVLGIFYSFGGALYDFFTTGLNTGSALAFLALIGMPALFGLFGLLVGAIELFLLKIFSKWIKKIDLDVM